MYEDNEYDLNFGGVTFKDDDEFYQKELPGVQRTNVKSMAANLEQKLTGIPQAQPNPISSSNIQNIPKPPNFPHKPNPLNVSPNVFTSPSSYDRQQMENMKNQRDDAVRREIEAKNLEHQRWKELEFERQRNKTLSQNTDNIIYTRFYNYGLDLIPSYYSYLERKRAEELLSNLIRKNLNRLNEEQLEVAIKNLVKDTNPDSNKDTKIKIEIKPAKLAKKKSPTKKTSKKSSKKKTPAKKPSKKPSKKKTPKKKMTKKK